MRIKLHQIVDDDDHAAGISDPVIQMDIHAVVAVRQHEHRDLAGRNIIRLEGLERPLLHDMVRFLPRHACKIPDRDVLIVARHDVLRDLTVFTRLRETDAETLISLILELNTLFQKTEIKRALQRQNGAHVDALHGSKLTDRQMMDHLRRCQGVLLLFHISSIRNLKKRSVNSL